MKRWKGTPLEDKDPSWLESFKVREKLKWLLINTLGIILLGVIVYQLPV